MKKNQAGGTTSINFSKNKTRNSVQSKQTLELSIPIDRESNDDKAE
jgi:hypothetical protein